MEKTLAIARRELLAYVLSPAGYVIIALFMFLVAAVYLGLATAAGKGFAQGHPATLQIMFLFVVWILLLVAPAISMRAISDEYRQGTFEVLMTSPVTERQVVLGKFFGCLAFLIIMLLPTLIYVVMMEWYGRPDYGAVACGYAGVLLAGAAYLASGLLVSALTSSQVVAYLVTLFFWLIMLTAPVSVQMIVQEFGADSGSPLQAWMSWIRSATAVVERISPQARISDFTTGLVDTFNIVYFLSVTVVFLVATMKVLESRRWR